MKILTTLITWNTNMMTFMFRMLGFYYAGHFGRVIIAAVSLIVLFVIEIGAVFILGITLFKLFTFFERILSKKKIDIQAWKEWSSTIDSNQSRPEVKAIYFKKYNNKFWYVKYIISLLLFVLLFVSISYAVQYSYRIISIGEHIQLALFIWLVCSAVMAYLYYITHSMKERHIGVIKRR